MKNIIPLLPATGSRHAAPSWVAVMGNKDFSPDMIEQMEMLHPGSMKRPPHPLTNLEGASSTKSGCITCHAIGKPNADGSIGNCTLCHTRHTSSVEVARLPSTCGQCHLGRRRARAFRARQSV